MHGIRRGLLTIRPQEILANAFQPATLVVLAIFGVFSSLHAQTPITVGYKDFYYGTSIHEAPTAEKPESKLWWNDGYWWGSLWSPAASKYRIHRFDLAAQSWIDVGPDIDDRTLSLADALWDGQKLYVASHIYNGGSQSSGNTTPPNSARLYRYSYDAAADTYSLDAGFPVLVNSATSETLVLDKDSTGQLWVTWTQADKVYVNCSQGDDLTWSAPFVIPTQGSDLDSDDISTLIAFNGKIGVVWSNQSDAKIYFAVHHDNKPDTDWEAREIALEDQGLGAVADDHLNLKLTDDSGGNLYLTTKTSLSGSSAPGIYLLKRSFGGGWSKYVAATKSDDYTRPIVVIDDENRELYIFAKSGSQINQKKVSLSNINFPSGPGDAFIKSSGSVDINDATASKHNVTGATGLLVLASCEVSRFYYHNYIVLPSSGGTPSIISFTPTTGPVGTSVTITGNNFNGATSVAFNGTAATFAVNSNTQITATVPAGAATGKISVTQSGNTAVSANNFNVTFPTQYALTVNIAGSGVVNPAGGDYDAGTMVTLAATPNAGYQFSGWSGDLTGAANPATITMDANKNITATFIPSSSGGQVVYQETKTGGSSNSTTVTTSANLTGADGHLYLAAISTTAKVAVTSVSGLGLNWTLVKAQCSGRNTTGVEIWAAQGAPSVSGAVTATFASKPKNAVIAVSRYSNAQAANPIGNIVSGNTAGVNGACSGGADNSSYSFNLTASMSGAMIYSAAALRNRTHTPGAGYTERAEIKQGSSSPASAAVQDKNIAAAGTAALNGSFSNSTDWAVVGLEIKPSSSSGAQYTLTTNVSGLGNVVPVGGTFDAGTMVMLTATPDAGHQFSGWSGDLTGAANPATITMDANKNVTATFTALPPTQYSLIVNVSGSGMVNPSGGDYDAGAMVTLTATPDAGYQFSGWSGDLTGAANPATITMNANKNVTANFSASGGSGQIVHQETQTGASSNSLTVITSTSLAGANNDLYLAAIVSRSKRAVSSVSGLGLDWSLVKAQCSGRNLTGVEVWMAQGPASASGAVTATFASAPSNAVIAVSRYSGVDATNPFGSVFSGNTLGVDGACSGGVDNASYSFGLATTVNDAVIYGAAAIRSTTHTPGAGYTERAEIKQGSSSPATVAVQDKSVAAVGMDALEGSFGGSNDWAVVGIELKPQATTTSMSKRDAVSENKKLAGSHPGFELDQNYPNPFKPTTSISFTLPVACNVRLNVCDATGEVVRTLAAGEMDPGRHTVRWSGRGHFGRLVAAGTYVLKIEIEDEDGNHLFTKTRRMNLLQ